MKRLIYLAAAVASALSAAACSPLQMQTAATFVRMGVGSYCVAVTDEGKQAVRNIVTGGVPLIACPVGTVAASAPPAASMPGPAPLVPVPIPPS